MFGGLQPMCFLSLWKSRLILIKLCNVIKIKMHLNLFWNIDYEHIECGENASVVASSSAWYHYLFCKGIFNLFILDLY